VRRTFVVLVWFRITLTTFHARITTVHLYLSKLYLKHYWFHFFPDTVYISDICYEHTKIGTSTVKSDHKAIVAYTGDVKQAYRKDRTIIKFRKRSPTQHALFLEHVAHLNIEFDCNSSVQEDFDCFYECLLCQLYRFYPERAITLTSSDPSFITPAEKSQLRRKNKLICAGSSKLIGD